MQRVHRILTDEELAQGKTTRWMELEIHGWNFSIKPILVQHVRAFQ